MRAGAFAVAVLLLCGSEAFAQSSTASRFKLGRPSSAYLPRAVFLGAYVKDGATTPQVRVQWAVAIAEQSKDVLALAFELGGGYGVGFPQNAGRLEDGRMTFLYQHTAMAGVAYRGWRGSHFRWGIQILTGPFWYGARYENLPTENRFTGIIEGRARFGFDVGPVSLGVSGGYGSPYAVKRGSPTGPFAGGPVFGAYVDWWH